MDRGRSRASHPAPTITLTAFQMQKDYLKRKARQAELATATTDDESASSSPATPKKRGSTGTSGSKYGWWSGTPQSIKDGSGQEVREERVILYIHGESVGHDSLILDPSDGVQVVHSSSPRWTPTGIKSSGMRGRQELERSLQRTV